MERYSLYFYPNGKMRKEPRILLAWSKKQKNVIKYLEKTIKPIGDYDQFLEIVFSESNPLDCPFVLGFEKNRINAFGGFYLTEEEWEIIDQEFDKYKYALSRSLTDIRILIDALSQASRNYWTDIEEEISDTDEDAFNLQLYASFIRNHDLLNGDGTFKAIQNRLQMIRAYQTDMEMIKEYQVKMSLPYT